MRRRGDEDEEESRAASILTTRTEENTRSNLSGGGQEICQRKAEIKKDSAAFTRDFLRSTLVVMRQKCFMRLHLSVCGSIGIQTFEKCHPAAPALLRPAPRPLITPVSSVAQVVTLRVDSQVATKHRRCQFILPV